MRLPLSKNISLLPLLFLIFMGCGQFSSFDKQLKIAADEINKTCPMMIDSDTQLDKVENFPGKIFQYTYTLINSTKADYDSIQFDSLMKSYVIENIKTNPDLQIFRDNNVTIINNYKDKTGMLIERIIVIPEQYR